MRAADLGLLVGGLLALPLAAAARPLAVEVRAPAGAVLARLPGQEEGRTAYVPLVEVARLVRGGLRVGARQARLEARGHRLEVTRDSTRVELDRRVLTLSAPVRVRGGAWLVPGELLVRAVPALLGTGVDVRVAPVRPPSPSPGPTTAAASRGRGAAPRPSAPPARDGPPSPVLAGSAAGVVAGPVPPPPSAARTGSARPPRPREAGPPEPSGTVPPGDVPGRPPGAGSSRGARPVGAAADRPADRPGSEGDAPSGRVGDAGPAAGRPAAVEVRHHSYPTHTRIVIEGGDPGEPRPGEHGQDLLVPLTALSASGPPVLRPVGDGLVAALELGGARGLAVLRIRFERAPGAQRVFRLQDPPRLVLDLYRAAEPRPGPGAAPPAGSGAVPDAEPAAPRAPVQVRHRSYPSYTRVVLEGTRPFEPRLVESRGDLLVSLAGLAPPAAPDARPVGDGLVAALELGEARGAAALRIRFERVPGARRVFRLQDPPRLVLDFYRTPAPGREPAGDPGAGRAGVQTVVLDPGHGGHDPGAVGPGGLQEKDLTLDLARRLAAILEEELAVKVVLTRTRDQFVPLRERTTIANRHKADVFVSIHVNAAPHATAVGTESYFLSSEATDNAARAAAAFENRVIALEPGPPGGARDLVRSILWDLAQSEFQQESSLLAEALQDSLDRALRLPSRGVKQAPFYVLGGAAMPAALVEVGFISNPREEARLQDEGYRDRIARGLAAGLAAYKRRYDRKVGAMAGR